MNTSMCNGLRLECSIIDYSRHLQNTELDMDASRSNFKEMAKAYSCSSVVRLLMMHINMSVERKHVCKLLHCFFEAESLAY